MSDAIDEPSSRPPVLNEQLCFALYTAARTLTACYRPLLEDTALTYPQYLVLLTLWEQQEASVKQLGSALHLDYGTLTPMLKRLEAGGLIRRERRPDDERSVQVSLTAQGAGLRERLRPLPALIEEATGLEAQDLGTLRTLLWRVIDHIAAER